MSGNVAPFVLGWMAADSVPMTSASGAPPGGGIRRHTAAVCCRGIPNIFDGKCADNSFFVKAAHLRPREVHTSTPPLSAFSRSLSALAGRLVCVRRLLNKRVGYSHSSRGVAS